MKCIFIVTTLVVLMFCANAWAEEEQTGNVLDKRLMVYGGFMYHDIDGEFASNKKGRPHISVDMDDLGLDERDWTYIVGAKIKITKRLNMNLDYFGYHSDATKRADSEFNFDDVIIPIGARVDTSLDMDVYVVNFGYDLVHTEQTRFGIGLGAHIADLSLDIKGKARVGDTEFPLGEGHEDVTAPAPNIHVYGAVGFTNNFIMRFDGGWMSLKYDDCSGRLFFADVLLEYWPLKYAGIGGGFRFLDVDLDYKTNKKKEEYDVTFPGPVVYITVGF